MLSTPKSHGLTRSLGLLFNRPLRTHASCADDWRTGLLNATLEDEWLMAEFDKLAAKGETKELTYDELLSFVRQHPLGL